MRRVPKIMHRNAGTDKLVNLIIHPSSSKINTIWHKLVKLFQKATHDSVLTGRGPIEWPARSPDLSPLNYILFDQNYSNNPPIIRQYHQILKGTTENVNELKIISFTLKIITKRYPEEKVPE